MYENALQLAGESLAPVMPTIVTCYAVGSLVVVGLLVVVQALLRLKRP
jgi:hypothetical protein